MTSLRFSIGNDFQNQWATMFSGIVSRAMTLEILSTGVAGNYNGALQVVYYTQSFLSSSLLIIPLVRNEFLMII